MFNTIASRKALKKAQEAAARQRRIRNELAKERGQDMVVVSSKVGF